MQESKQFLRVAADSLEIVYAQIVRIGRGHGVARRHKRVALASLQRLFSRDDGDFAAECLQCYSCRDSRYAAAEN